MLNFADSFKTREASMKSKKREFCCTWGKCQIIAGSQCILQTCPEKFKGIRHVLRRVDAKKGRLVGCLKRLLPRFPSRVPKSGGNSSQGPDVEVLERRDPSSAELKGSIGEGPNHSNHSNHSNSFKIGILPRKFKIFRKFQHFLNYRRNSDKISSKSERKSSKRIQK